VVLIELAADDEGMFWYVVLAFIVLVGPLAYLYGADSRIDERARRDRIST
jgi:hypothetical protein